VGAALFANGRQPECKAAPSRELESTYKAFPMAATLSKEFLCPSPLQQLAGWRERTYVIKMSNDGARIHLRLDVAQVATLRRPQVEA